MTMMVVMTLMIMRVMRVIRSRWLSTWIIWSGLRSRRRWWTAPTTFANLGRRRMDRWVRLVAPATDEPYQKTGTLHEYHNYYYKYKNKTSHQE